jgi:hypothetical protein
MIKTGFEMVFFGFHCAAGKVAHPADQQSGGFPLRMGIDGGDSIRIAIAETVFESDPVQH